MASTGDPRYQTYRWRQVRLRVLKRDLHRCRIVPGCSERATVADHIVPVTPDLPDALFYALSNLRAGCRDHNLARGFAAKPRMIAQAERAVTTKDYS